ncbi:MAG: hypothetical protein O2843_09100, partial [Chloroflexi bacterium]|nr:hypothetical protein [Chloroflexota bacterium]
LPHGRRQARDRLLKLPHRSGQPQHEVHFYQTLGDDLGVSTPRCYFARFEQSVGRFALLIEDMSDCRVGAMRAAPVEDIEEAIRQIAPFHARWWAHPRLNDLGLRIPG